MFCIITAYPNFSLMISLTEQLSFPIGRAQLPDGLLSAAERTALIQQIAELPAQLTVTVQAVGDEYLQRPYRPSGWTGRQVIHHLADSHLNCYCRFRLALTEDNPTVRLYDEKAWAELPDVATTPITVSLTLLEALHTRWVMLLHHISEAQWQRTFYHPGTKRDFTLDQVLAMYAWHGQHHLAHLKLLLPPN